MELLKSLGETHALLFTFDLPAKFLPGQILPTKILSDKDPRTRIAGDFPRVIEQANQRAIPALRNRPYAANNTY